MAAREINFELTFNRMDIVVVERGKTVASMRLPVDLNNDATVWTKQIRDLAPSVKSFVDEHKLSGANARVFYASPTHAVDVVSAPIRAQNQAIDAAVLSCTDSLSYSSLSAICEGIILGRDKNRDGEENTHVLVAAEREDVAEAIIAMVQDAGLYYVSATPSDAVVMGSLAQDALACDQTTRGELHLGHNASFFVIGGNRCLLFERRLSIGLQTIIQALQRPIRLGAQSDETVSLTEDEAREILFTHGVPDRTAIVHAEHQITGAQVIPLLQPSLQRLVVELRQSLRFGLHSDADRDFTIMLTGPGAVIPGLAGIVAHELQFNVACAELPPDVDLTTPGGFGSSLSLAAHHQRMATAINLQSHPLARQRRATKLKRWLWTGAVTALAVLGMDFMSYQGQIREAQQRVDALSAQVNIEDLRQTIDSLTGAMASLTKLETNIHDRVASNVRFGGLMHELSTITPASIRLTNIELARTEDQMSGRLTGYALEFEDADQAKGLAEFVKSLQRCPLMSNVVLGDVNTGSINGQESTRFEIRFDAVNVPHTLSNQLVDASDTGNQP